MDEKELLEDVIEGIVNGDIDKVKKLCQNSISMNIPAYRVVMDGMAEGMKIVGKKY